MDRSRLLALALLAQAVWIAGIVGAPYLAAHGYDSVAERLYSAYRPFCHQKAERSLSVFGGQMAVCARCFGIYAGAIAGSLAATAMTCIRKDARIIDIRLVGLALLPLAIDGVTQLLELRGSSEWLRLATGLLFGCVFAYYFLPLAISRLARSS